MESVRPGEYLGGRYLVKQNFIVLDTHPGSLPEASEDMTEDLEPYLRLFPYQLQLPQVYGLVSVEASNSARSPRKKSRSTIVLLDRAPIYPEGVTDQQMGNLEGTLMPEWMTVWPHTTALRQLNWLWQIAHLWEPLSRQGVVSTVLSPGQIRVEGALIRLLELQFDSKPSPTLADLGKFWRQLQATATVQIADFLDRLCQQLTQGNLKTAEQLVAVLDRALIAYGQTQFRQIQLTTRTDQGPSRQRNEDACYPPDGTFLTVPTVNYGDTPSTELLLPLAVVCDGIGGHEGGNVASNLAIATVQQKLQALPLQTTQLGASTLMAELEEATLAANDAISQRNDSEQRQERQRMGTTLVMALVHAHELYLTNVGDSRAYRITRTGCHQVTQDDDLASREVRLGYSFYRHALQQPGSGSLVQALGMSASSMLHPAIQRFVLDEDCLFLLCSDGLSDNDRVEQHWQTELLPILNGTLDIVTASQRLVAIANSLNGHDNVTVALIYCQVTPDNSSDTVPTLDSSILSAVTNGLVKPDTSPPIENSTTKTQLVSRRASPKLLSILAGLFVFSLLGGLLIYLGLPEAQAWISGLLGNRPDVSSSQPSPGATAFLPASPLTSGTSSSTSTTPGVSVGSLIRVERVAQNPAGQLIPTALLPQPPGVPTKPTAAPAPVQTIPVGSILQISRRQEIPNQGYWLQLKVCSVPPVSAPVLPIVAPGAVGWVEQSGIIPLVTQNLTLTAPQLGACVAGSPAPTNKLERPH